MWDLTGVKEASYSTIPAGEYLVYAKAGEVKPTKTGDGAYVKVEFTVVGEEHEGRKLFHNFNIKNPNAKAVEIGLSQIKGFFKAAGVREDQLKSIGPDDFAGQSCLAVVAVEPSAYGEQNVIKYFKALSETQPLPVTAKGTAPVKPKMKATF